jgi:hypothetical protein
MLNGICSYLQNALRTDADLKNEFGLGSDASDGAKICQVVYPGRIFDESENGLAMYMTDFPVAGVFMSGEESTIVDQENGMAGDLVVQYACKGQAGDTRTMGDDTGWPSHIKMGLVLSCIWWKLRDYLQNPSALLSSYRIERIYMDRVRFIPPLANGVYVLEATGVCEYPLPPWFAYPDSVSLTSHDGTLQDESLGDAASEIYTVEATETARPWSEE